MTRILFFLIPLVAFAVYAWLTPPVSGMGDASELTLVLATNGVPHPTGYPLYVALGHPFVTVLHGLGADYEFKTRFNLRGDRLVVLAA